MRMIIGGAYQGKTRYAAEKYALTAGEIADGAEISEEKISAFRCVNCFHLFVKKCLENGADPIGAAEKILGENPSIIIIMDEIGNGIVPLEKSERIWREQVGKTGCFLAERAESVERIICGMCVKIKG